MEGYAVGVITLLAINCIAAMGVSLFTGFTGIFTLGHAGYMAIGAYTAAILTVEHGVHFIPAIIAGGILAMILSYLIGIPTLKLVGDYYAIVSLGLGEARRAHQLRQSLRAGDGPGIGQLSEGEVGRQQRPGESLDCRCHGGRYSVLTLIEPMLSMAMSCSAEVL